MWRMIPCIDGYLLEYNGRVVATNSGPNAYRALVEFGGIVANLNQAVAA